MNSRRLLGRVLAPFLLVPVIFFVGASPASADEESDYLCSLIYSVGGVPSTSIKSCGGQLANQSWSTLDGAEIRVKDIAFENALEALPSETVTDFAAGHATVKITPKNPAGVSTIWGGFSVCKPEGGVWKSGTTAFPPEGPYVASPGNNWANAWSDYQAADLHARYERCLNDITAERRYLVYTGIGTGDVNAASVKGLKATDLSPDKFGADGYGTSGALGITDVTATLNSSGGQVIKFTVGHSCGATYNYTGGPSQGTQINTCFQERFDGWKAISGTGHNTAGAFPPDFVTAFTLFKGTSATTAPSTSNSQNLQWTSGVVPGSQTPCLQKPSGSQWIFSETCEFSVSMNSEWTYLWAGTRGATPPPSYSTITRANSPGIYFASYTPSNPLWAAESSSSFSGYDMHYALIRQSIFDELTVVPDAPGLDEDGIEDSGLCMDTECVFDQCNLDGIPGLADFFCLVIPPDFNWGKLSNTFQNSLYRSPMYIAVNSAFDVMEYMAKDFASLNGRACSNYDIGPEDGYFKDAKLDLCPEALSGVNWALYRKMLGFVILFSAVFVCLRMIKGILFLEKQISFGIFDSDEGREAKGFVYWTDR